MKTLGKKPARDALKTVRKRLDDALEKLDGAGPLADRVHAARRSLKKARSILRLLQPALPKKDRKALCDLCGEAGRALGPARDGAALEKAWLDLRLDGQGAGLLLQRRQAAERAMQDGEALRECRRALKKAQKRADKLEPDDDGWDAAVAGLERSCRRLQEAFEAAQRERTDDAYHAWRKRAKDLRYQLELLAHPEHRSIGRLVELLKSLTDLLGDDHDLVELGAVVAGEPDEFGGLSAAKDVEEAVMRKRRALRRAALALARRWSPDKPHALAERARRSWKEARNLKE